MMERLIKSSKYADQQQTHKQLGLFFQSDRRDLPNNRRPLALRHKQKPVMQSN